MGRSIHKLNAKKVERLTTAGWHGDGGGLWLRIQNDGSKRWVFVWKRDKKRREMGLGSFSIFNLDEARGMAAAARELLKDGHDPIALRKETIETEKAERASVESGPASSAVPTFSDYTERFIAAHEDGWSIRSTKQWRSSLANHAKALHRMPVDEITADDLVDVLKPIWNKIPETAGRLRGRIELILDAAKAEGHIESPWENPARWKDNLLHRLFKQKRVEIHHFSAIPYEDIPDFFADLRQRSGTAVRSLEFTILCATRTGEAIGMKWGEIDFNLGIWTIPAERMKMRVEHRVPLSPPAINLLYLLRSKRSVKPENYVFPGRKEARPLSLMSMAMVLRRMNYGHVTVHGMRSAFRDYMGDMTSHAETTIEHCLAHSVGNSTVRAYRRRDAFEKRKIVMADWADYLLTSEVKANERQQA